MVPQAFADDICQVFVLGIASEYFLKNGLESGLVAQLGTKLDHHGRRHARTQETFQQVDLLLEGNQLLQHHRVRPVAQAMS